MLNETRSNFVNFVNTNNYHDYNGLQRQFEIDAVTTSKFGLP